MEALCEIVRERGTLSESLERLFYIVFETAEGDDLVFEDHVRRPPVAVAGLPHRTDVDERAGLGLTVPINAVDRLGLEELVGLRLDEDPRMVGVAREADLPREVGR